MLDMILSFSGLVILSPFYLLIMVAVVIDDLGPVMFHKRELKKEKLILNYISFEVRRYKCIVICQLIC